MDLEERLKFHGNERVKRIQEVRKRNKRKRRFWVSLLLLSFVVTSIHFLDQRGAFELFFDKRVYYENPAVFEEVLREDGQVSRESLVKTAMLLINHPYAQGAEAEVLGIPEGPVGSGGFVDWLFYNLTGTTLSAGSAEQGPLSTKIWAQSEPVMEHELQVGDLGFRSLPEGSKMNPMGVYLGEHQGEKVFIHAGGVSYGAEGLEEGRVVLSYNNSLKRNQEDLAGYKFSPSAPPTQFVYYRRPSVSFID